MSKVQNIWTVVLIMVVTGAVCAGGTYYFMNRKAVKEAGKYYTNSFDINTFRTTIGALASGSHSAYDNLGNGWLRFNNPDERYSVEIPNEISGQVFTPVPVVVFQRSTSESHIGAAYRDQVPWVLLDVKIPNVANRDSQRIRVLNSYSDFPENENRYNVLQTYDASNDADIINAAKEFYDAGCNFTSITKTPSAQSGTFDVAFNITNANTDACPSYLVLDEGMKAHDYKPSIARYSPTAKKVLFTGPVQGCRWPLADGQGTCADEKIFNSIKFSQ
jgi:hypothetical protein